MRGKHVLSHSCIFFFGLVLLFPACSKKHESIQGNVTINGRIIDEISGTAIPDAIVTLYSYKLTGTGLGGTTSVLDYNRTYGADTTDGNGYYELSVAATGQYEFEAGVEVNNDQYVNTSTRTNGQNIKSTGTYTRDLVCGRSAFAKIIIINRPPLDTTSFLQVSGSSGSVLLHNFYKDSIVYVKIKGGLENPTQLRLESSNINNYRNVSAARWDTVTVPFNY